MADRIVKLIQAPRFICKLLNIGFCALGVLLEYHLPSTLRVAGGICYLEVLLVLLIIWFFELPSRYTVLPILGTAIVCNAVTAILGIAGVNYYGVKYSLIPLAIASISTVNAIFLFIQFGPDLS